MRTSTKRTPVAVLRTIIGIKDFEMAELLGCSCPTIHSLESGRLKLSENMVERLLHETGIAPEWLLGGNPLAVPRSLRGERYTKSSFDRAQAAKAVLDRPPETWLLNEALDLCARLVSTLSKASAQKKYQLAFYKASKAIQALASDFGQDKALYSPTRFGQFNRDEAVALMKKLCEKRGRGRSADREYGGVYDDLWGL